jgi:hypothetical protein
MSQLDLKRKIDDISADQSKKSKVFGESADENREYTESVMAATAVYVEHTNGDELSPPVIGDDLSDGNTKLLLDAIQSLKGTFDERLCEMEARLTKQITNVFSVEIKKVKEEFQAKVDDLTEKLVKLEKSYASVTASAPVQKHSIVIKNIKLDEKESTDRNVTVNKAQCLVRDGLKLQNVKVVSAVRKTTRGSMPGIIVAEVESNDQKYDILKAKRMLKGSKNYNNVYIDNDLPADVRNTEASLRTILKELGKEKQYFARGTRLIKNTRY